MAGSRVCTGGALCPAKTQSWAWRCHMAESLGHLTLRSELGSFRGTAGRKFPTNSGTLFTCGVPWLWSFIKRKAQAHLALGIPSSGLSEWRAWTFLHQMSFFIPAPTVLPLQTTGESCEDAASKWAELRLTVFCIQQSL